MTPSRLDLVRPPACDTPLTAACRRGDCVRARGFSLVETALALGVIAFALTALVALLPGALTQFRQAMDVTIGAQIYQRMVTDLEQSDFEALLEEGAGAGQFHALPTRFFDDQGEEIAAADHARLVYQVRVRISPPGPASVGSGSAGFTSLPAAPGVARFAPRDAVFVTIQIAHRPQPHALPTGPDGLWMQSPGPDGAPLQTYSAIITRNGHSREARR